MGFADFVVRQLGHPEGRAGHLVLRLLNRANAGINQATLEMLDATPDDRLLEIGFGGGDLMARLLRGAPPAQMTGVERSAAAVAHARRRFAEAIQAQRVRIVEADVQALPFDALQFTAACMVNTIYFWPDIQPPFAELHRVLQPGGRLVVSYNSIGPGAKAGLSRSYAPAEVEAALQAVGLATPETATYAGPFNVPYYCTRALKP